MIADPTAFIAEAERMTNERDVTAIRGVFTPAGRWTTLIDGVRISASGLDEIEWRWGVLCAVMARRELTVRKRVLLADQSTIVSDWTGTAARGANPYGLEVWHLDDDGLVHDQMLFGFLDPRSVASPVAGLRLLATQPQTALAFAGAQLRGGGAR